MANSAAAARHGAEGSADLKKGLRNARAQSRPRISDGKSSVIRMALDAEKGFSKASADELFRRIAAAASFPVGKVRADLIPDSSWKRARKTLGPQASQTAARVRHIFTMAERVWGNEEDALEWLTSPHMELEDATPLSFLRTEAGGRAIEYLLGALEYGFPV
jgi:putative toxin-antitoxin system antitoxin component (TIGR02293 family)